LEKTFLSVQANLMRDAGKPVKGHPPGGKRGVEGKRTEAYERELRVKESSLQEKNVKLKDAKGRMGGGAG